MTARELVQGMAAAVVFVMLAVLLSVAMGTV